MRTSMVAGVLAALAGPLAAQDQAPAHWVTRLDAPAQPVTGREVGQGEYQFVLMPPGWHVTMGPGAILYDPAYRANGRYALEAEIFLFPGTSAAGYGLFLGGDQLDESGHAWLAVLLRRDGAVALVRREGERDLMVVPWAVHPAVKPQAGDDVVANTLRVDVGRDSVRVEVNGEPVLATPRGELRTDGHFGFRVGEGINLHASTLDLTQRLAAPRGG